MLSPAEGRRQRRALLHDIFGNVGGALGTTANVYDLDVSRVTFGANALTLKNGTATAVVPSGLLALVSLLRVACATNAIAFG